MTSAASELEHHIKRLHGNGRLRVWSLIITFFGDVVALRGGRVALSTLQDAMGLLHIEPGAVRTALSRLAGEGWVERERQGRLSFYKLTAEGRAKFDEPTRLIYASSAGQWDGEWTVAVDAGDNSLHLQDQGFVSLGGKAWLRAGGDAGSLPDDLLVITGKGSRLPTGLLSLWPLDEQAALYSAFIDDWQDFGTTGNIAAAEAMSARTLLIHDWRRIVLRDPALPDVLLPDDWIGHKARRLAGQTYRDLMQGSEEWLDDNGLSINTEPDVTKQRFNVLRNIAS